MATFIRKITSRKFLVAILGVIVGIATAFGIDESEYASIAGMVTALGSIITYIIGEAKVDAAHALPYADEDDLDYIEGLEEDEEEEEETEE